MATPTQRAEARRLSRTATRRAAVLDQLSRRFGRELSRVLRELERGLLARLPAIQARSRTALIDASSALALRRELRDALRDAGYDDLILTGSERAFTRLERVVGGTTVGREVARFVTPDRALDVLRALRVLQVTGLEYQGDTVATELWHTLTRRLYTQTSVRDLVRALAVKIDRSERETRTLYDTATATYTRVRQAMDVPDDPSEAWLYAGPDDLKTRPFCEAHVDRVYSRQAIDQMDNDTPDLADVFRYGGGYNCRHVWMHVPKGTSLADLADTGEDVGPSLGLPKRVPRTKAA